MENSFALPSYWRILADPEIKTILITGCGGGFDFVHSMTLYPELKRMGKQIIIGSYSFGAPEKIQGGEVVFDKGDSSVDLMHVMAKKVDGKCIPDRNYGPEVGICQFLDVKFPTEAPHSVYAYYARHFSVTDLTELYVQLCTQHNVDCILVIDGGSDSLMRGDEAGLGDPIEDATSICAAHLVGQQLPKQIKAKILVSVGFGCDRFNGISDGASLRCIAEMTAAGGFLGSMSLESTSPLLTFYDECIQHLQSNAFFRSVISNSIIEAGKGAYGDETAPKTLKGRVQPGQLFFWPLMAMHFAFSVDHLLARSHLCPLLLKCKTVQESYLALDNMREKFRKKKELRKWEMTPSADPKFSRD